MGHQRKVIIAPADDPLEKEADAVAALVMDRLPPTLAATECLTTEPDDVASPWRRDDHPVESACQEPSEATGQRSLAAIIEATRGTGLPLPEPLRRAMEGAFETDFSDIVIHDDWLAHRLNCRLGSDAFATGRDIFFRRGTYDPASRRGQTLIAHELTHVVQQTDDLTRRRYRRWNGLCPSPGRRAADTVGFGNSSPRDDLVIQRKISCFPGPKFDQIAKEISENIDWYFKGYSGLKTDELKITKSLIKDKYKEMQKSTEDYGLFDLEDYQQRAYFLAALCHLISGKHKPTAPGSNKAPDVYSLALVGRGSSIAYYLNSLPPTYDHSNSILVGLPDPWGDNASGRGRGYINHQNQLIAHWRERAPSYSEDYVNRAEFARANDEIISASKIGTTIDKRVISITESGKNFVIEVDDTKNNKIKTKKVVVGLGSGPHWVPYWLEHIREKENDKRTVMNIDEFMRYTWDNGLLNKKRPYKNLSETKIIVDGPNAGIDAVERAGRCGIRHENILWLIGNTPPQLLEGNTLEHASKVTAIGVDRSKTAVTKEARRLTVELEQTGTRYQGGEEYKGNAKGRINVNDVDLYVFALGPDIKSPRSVKNILSRNIRDSLGPIYDVNQRISDFPLATVLGLQTRNTTSDRGLQVIGASAFRLAQDVKNNDLKNNDLKNNYADVHLIMKQTLESKTSTIEMLKLDRQIIDSHRAMKEKSYEAFGKADSSSIDFLDKVKKFVSDLRTKRRVIKKDKDEVIKALTELINVWEHWISIHNTLRVGETVQKQMSNQFRYDAPSVIIPEQLNAIRTAVGALNTMVPRYITRESNFIGDDRTMLQIYIATSYPQIDKEVANDLVSEFFRQFRRRKDYPYGFESGQVEIVFDAPPTGTKPRWSVSRSGNIPMNRTSKRQPHS